MKKSLFVRLSEAELEILKNYCEQTDRTQSDVIREFIRSLQNTEDFSLNCNINSDDISKTDLYSLLKKANEQLDSEPKATIKLYSD